MTATAAAPSQPAFNRWAVIGFILIPVFIGSLDLTVVSAFLPKLLIELGIAFETGLDDASWIITGYLLAYTCSLTFMGRLSDLFGRRAIYAACLLVFIVGSVVVSLANTPLFFLGDQSMTEQLYALYRRSGMRPDIAYVELQVIIIGRVIAALGAGALVPVSMALVGDMFPPDQRAQPLGVVAAFDTLGWVLGPVYGAIFLQFVSWQVLFLFNVPLTLLTLFAVLWALRNVPQLRAQGRFDFLGTLLIVGALSCLTIGLGANVDVGGVSGSIDALQPLPEYAAPVLTLGLGLFLAFLFVEKRVRDPLIRLVMFTRRNLAAATLTNLLIGYVLFIGLVIVPILVNIRQQDSSQLQGAALQVGALLSTLTVPMAFAALLGGVLSARFGIRPVVIGGILLSLGGFLLVALTWTVTIADAFVALQMAIVGVGIGLTFSPISAAIINSATDSERGVASALVLIVRLVGMTVSVSSLSSLALFRVNVLANAARSEVFTPSGFLVIYTDAVLQVLREIGALGVLFCLVALLPAAFLGRTANPPDA